MSLSLEMTFLLFSSLYIKLLCEKNPWLWISFLRVQQNHSIDIFKMDGLKSIRIRDESRFLQWSWKSQHHQVLVQCNSVGFYIFIRWVFGSRDAVHFLEGGLSETVWLSFNEENWQHVPPSWGTFLGPSVHKIQWPQINSLKILGMGVFMTVLMKNRSVYCYRIARKKPEV